MVSLNIIEKNGLSLGHILRYRLCSQNSYGTSYMTNYYQYSFVLRTVSAWNACFAASDEARTHTVATCVTVILAWFTVQRKLGCCHPGHTTSVF